MNRATRPSRPGLTGSTSKSLLLSAAAGGVVLKAGPDTTTSTSLTWTAPEYKPNNYRVERSLDGASFTTVTTVDSATFDYNDTGRTESTQYWYRIVPILGGADQPASNVADTWTVPSTPTTLTATAVGGTQIDLTWVDVSTGNTGQIIERRTPSGSGSYSLLATVSATATTYSDTGLTPGQSYEYRVAATNPATLSAYSNAASATPSATPTAAWTLDFSSGEPWANGTNYTFSSTASTTRTFVNSSGYVAPCVANLLLYSEQFNQNVAGAWTVVNGVTIGSNVTTAPDNTTTADELIEDSATSRHNVGTGSRTVSQSLPYTLSCYVKANNRSYCALTIYAAGGTGARFCQVFDLTGSGSLGSTDTLNSPTGTSGTITAVGNGWFRVTATMDSQTNTSLQVAVSASNSATPTFASQAPSYLGAGNSAVYVWGAQLVQGAAALPYSATTTSSNGIPRLTHNSSGSRLGLLVEGQRTNLVQRSGEFENAWWDNAAQTTCAGVTTPTAPDNSTDAAELKETTANNNHHRGQLGTTVSSGSVTFSAFVKKQSRRYVGLYVITFGGGNSYRAIFDLDNSAAFSAGNASGTPNASTGSENYGNGWFRIWITLTTGVTTALPGVFLSDRSDFSGTLSSGLPSYTGSTSESVYVWGLQMENAATPSSYIPTVASSVTRSADLAHVLDTNITSWGDPGALVVHFYPPGQAGTLISTDDAATAQVGIEASTTTAARAFWSSGSTATGTIGTGVQKAVHYWNGTNSRFCINAGTVQTGTNNFTIANADFVTLGAEATDSAGVPGTFSQYSNCIIRRVEFYSGTLTDANLQTITGPTSYTVDALVVAGGGGGARGGGGAGGYRTATGFTLTPGTSYTITVGAGGAAGSVSLQGVNGSNSVFSTITSTGGGGGGRDANGSSGGSGGGGGSNNIFNYNGGAGTSGEGNSGGNQVHTGTPFPSAGGGGASAAGQNTQSNSQSGNGGDGSTFDSVVYAGGGGGGNFFTGGTNGSGGSGGGGAGTSNGTAGSGTANRGGGGGGSGSGGTAGSGGSGIVIIRMPTANYSGVHTPATVTTSGSDTILTFTSSGNYVA